MALQCDIVTPESKYFSDEVEFVVLPAANGEMGVYQMHDPVVTTLNAGTVRVTAASSNTPVKFAVAGGYAQVEAERVIILADRACAIEGLNKEEIAAAKAALEAQLAGIAADDPQAAFVKSELAWNELLLNA